MDNISNNETNAVSSTDHDRLFKELLTTFFLEFLELFLPQVAKYLNRASITSRDKEVFTDVTAGEKYETDILMQAQFNQVVEGREGAFFLIHVENQATNQTYFPKRMFRYFARLYEKHDLDIYPIAVFSYANPLYAAPHQHTVDFPDKRILDFKYEVIQLNQLKWQDFLASPNPVASALMAKMQIEPADRPKVKARCIAMMLGLQLDQARNQLITGFVDSYLDLDAAEKQIFQIELDALVPPQPKEKFMKIVTSWQREGRVEGKTEMLLQLLNRKVGLLASEATERVQALPETQLNQLADALFDFSNATDLSNWLEQHSHN